MPFKDLSLHLRLQQAVHVLHTLLRRHACPDDATRALIVTLRKRLVVGMGGAPPHAPAAKVSWVRWALSVAWFCT